MWRPSRSLVSSRRIRGIEIMPASITSAKRGQICGEVRHLLRAQLEGGHVRIRTLRGRIPEPALEIVARIFGPDLREIGADRRPHLADRVAAVAAVVHEVALALVDR